MTTQSFTAQGTSMSSVVYSGPRELRITLSGELDLFSEDLTPALAGIALDRIDHAVIDLGGLDFVDTGGLRRLVALREFIAGQDVAVSLRNAQPQTRRIMGLLGADRYLSAPD